MTDLIQLGKEAERWLESEPYKRSIGGVRDFYIAKLAATKPRDDVERRVWCEMLNALGMLDANMRALAGGGKQASEQLEAYTPKPEESRFARMFPRKSA